MTLVNNTLDAFRLRRKSVFRYPMDPAPRTAVLAACFRQPRFRPNYPVRVFPKGWSEEVAEFAPAALAAPREQLVALAAGQPPRLTHAVIVLESRGDPLLSIAERSWLWRAFRVPVFEQIIEPDGELLAFECEAHDGLHTEIPGLNWNGYGVELSPCGCGRKTPRLTPAQPAEPAERLRSVAAYAR